MIKQKLFTAGIFLILFFSAAALPAEDLFWEEAAAFSPRTGTFPVSAHSGSFSAVAWQESSPNTGGGGVININLAVKQTGENWEQRGVISGPYQYPGAEPSILSLVIDNQNRIIIAAAAGDAHTEILISQDLGRTFSRNMLNMGAENSVAPRLHTRADGGYLLFITRGRIESMSIYYSRSEDGINWSSFEPFVTESNLTLNFLPTHASAGQRDVVFFQSISMGYDSLPTFQLYFKYSDNGGRTWSEAKQFTTFNDPVMTNIEPRYIDNQRPHLTSYGNNLLLVWERRFANQSPQIYSAVINSSGSMIGRVERVNSVEAYCHNPIGFIHKDRPFVVWFDSRSGNNRVILAQRDEYDYSWTNYPLSSAVIEASFSRPIVCDDGIYVFWQTTAGGANRIYVLAPDASTVSPRITTLNFTPSSANRSERPRVTWNIPVDTSGIYGFSWIWDQNPESAPPDNIMIYNVGNTGNLNLELNADNDGEWYFKVSAMDFAGNWSAPSQVMYYRKTAAPPELAIIEPELDEQGFILSNTFNILWQPSDDPYISGYTWNLQYLGDSSNEALRGINTEDFDPENFILTAPPSRIMGTTAFANYINQEDGAYAFTVSAIDEAGNIGQPVSIFFNANKFIPYTSVTYIDARQNEQGELSIRLLGRGFSTNGVITAVVLEQEGKPDRITYDFNVISDSEIDGIFFEIIEEGQYSLRLEHSQRGWYTASAFVPVIRTGTVKFGDYTKEWIASWRVNPIRWLSLNPITGLAVVLIIFCVLGAIAMIRGIGLMVTEGSAVKQEAKAIITGDYMPMEKKQKVVKIKISGRGLRFKLASFTIGLILLVVIMISTPMYVLMTNTQRETLLQSLYERSKVLLEGIASSAGAYLPMAIQSMGEYGALELMFLPSQSSALREANYITITGYGINSINTDHVWATNDPEILSKIDTNELRSGVSRITDSFTPYYNQLYKDLDTRTREEGGVISQNIRELYEEGLRRALDLSAEAEHMRADIQVAINSLELQLNDILSEISGEIGSYPEFSKTNISSEGDGKYIFYKPIMYRQNADDILFRGLIRLEVSLVTIVEEIYQRQMELLSTIGIYAAIGLVIGVIAAFVFSIVIIRPIRKLVRHIERIRDTEDKTKLAGVDIDIKTRDEIAILSDTVNDMTYGLVKAAMAASDLSIGKEIQKKFIPLEVDHEGNKQSSGFKNTNNLNFFGYYEGAKGVSGDYFDYRDLDGRYYAIIKCDVAGKGIPAALIIIQVATMFIGHFRRWKPTEKGFHIEDLAYQINDFIEALGFKGRFAAFTLCLFDSETGVVRFCNAGDNVVHFYDESEGKLKAITLPQTPATGVLPNFMIQTTGGYKVQTLKIEKGDILLLYTDCIEEAKRKFRDTKFKEITCTAGPDGTVHENHLSGQADEELGPDRVEAIINAVMARKIYTLHKHHNPEGEVELQFDFSTCEGHVEEVIMAMVSVEKMFRCYKPENAAEDSRILVDKKVDEFLKNHFLQYRKYCSYTREFPENPAYMYYTHVMEDEQYDDLTILGIKRKNQ